LVDKTKPFAKNVLMDSTYMQENVLTLNAHQDSSLPECQEIKNVKLVLKEHAENVIKIINYTAKNATLDTICTMEFALKNAPPDSS